jgi:microcystin degradation protein MlrC
MPSRILESYVQKGISSGMGMMSPDAVAEAICHIAGRGEKIPLRVPLGSTAWMMAKMKHEGALKELESVKDVSERPVRKVT